jgi:hypothetical protein
VIEVSTPWPKAGRGGKIERFVTPVTRKLLLGETAAGRELL